MLDCIACVRFWLSARTSLFIDQFVGFSFVNTVAEAHWRSGSARLPVSFADQKPGPLNPFLSDKRPLGPTTIPRSITASP